jgi:hypothetical protein
MRIAEQSRRRISKLLRGHRCVAVGSLAGRVIAHLALPAFATIDVEGHDDPVALLQLVARRPGLDHLAHEFMPKDVAALHRRHQAVHEMEI